MRITGQETTKNTQRPESAVCSYETSRTIF